MAACLHQQRRERAIHGFPWRNAPQQNILGISDQWQWFSDDDLRHDSGIPYHVETTTNLVTGFVDHIGRKLRPMQWEHR